ncbi:MAG: hypothetical protein FK734_18870 [Asgard group archaeon]|nr:hypothetical protein [Asgard group archaeon]
MAILEAGVMFGGMPIVRVDYFNEKVQNTMLTAGLLEAIQSFAIEIFNDETESFKMKKYSIFLHKTKLKNEQDITLYSICDSVDRPNTIKDIMKTLAIKFYNTFPEVNLGCLTNYECFKEIITKSFGDLIYSPEERLKKVFLDEQNI